MLVSDIVFCFLGGKGRKLRKIGVGAKHERFVMDIKLTERVAKFAQYYVLSESAAKAYRWAFEDFDLTARETASKAASLLERKDVKEYVKFLRSSSEQNAVLTKSILMQELALLVMADASKIVMVRRDCCRYCHGVGGAYQWVNDSEFQGAINKWAQQCGKEGQNDPAMPSDDGGYGYDRVRPPEPSCAVCGGDGHETVINADSRTLGPAERRLYDGAKMGRHGVEIKLRNRDPALALLAKALGIDPSNPVSVSAEMHLSQVADLATLSTSDLKLKLVQGIKALEQEQKNE